MVKNVGASFFVAMWMFYPSLPSRAVVHDFPAKSTYSELPVGTKAGELKIPMTANINSFFQLMAPGYEVAEYILRGPLYTRLINIDPDTYEYLPALASSYSVSEDKKSYKVVLDKSAKWSDGSPITSQDIVFTLSVIKDKKYDTGRIRPYYDGIEVKAIDKHTVVFTAENPKFNTLFNISMLFPISHKTYEGKDLNKEQTNASLVTSSGPYILKEYKPDLHIILERKKDWWGDKRPHLAKIYNYESIYYPIINDRNLVYEKLVKGEVDIFSLVSADVWALRVKGNDSSKFADSRAKAVKLKKKLVNVKALDKEPKTYDYIGWNTRSNILKSKNVRRALAHLIPYDEVMKKAYFDLAIQATSPFGSQTDNSDPSLRKENMINYNPKVAMKLLQQEGWGDSDRNGVLDKKIDGKKVEFRINMKFNQGNNRRKTIAFIAKKALKKFGIIVDVKELEWTAMVNDMNDGKFDSYILGWAGGSSFYRNPKQIWHSGSHGSGGSNYVAYSNKEVDELIEQANKEFDIKKRTLLMQQISRKIYEDQPYTFLGERYNLHLMSTNVGAPEGKYYRTYSPLPIETFSYAKAN